MSRKDSPDDLEQSLLSSATTVETGPPEPLRRGFEPDDTLVDRLPAVGRLDDEGEAIFDPTRFAAHKIPPDLRLELSRTELKRVDPARFLDTGPPDSSAPSAPIFARRDARLRRIRRRVGFTAAALLALAAALVAAQGILR